MDNFPRSTLASVVAPISQPEALTLLREIRDLLDERLPARRPSSRRARARESGPERREYGARSFVQIQLRKNGPMQWCDIVAEGKKFGQAASTMRKRRHEIADKFVEDGRWFWRLKPEVEAEYGQADRRS